MFKYPHETAVLYHWWCESDCGPYHDLSNPVVASIATLRARNATVPIYVLDCSEKQRSITDWEEFPDLLKFKVIPWQHRYQHDPVSKYHMRLCSRVWDIWEAATVVPEPKILFTDADVFWLKNPFPLVHNQSTKLCCSSNTGVFYFDKRSKEASKAFGIWKALLSLAYLDPTFRDEVYRFSTSVTVQDEVVFNQLLRWLPEMIEQTPIEENCIIDMFRYQPEIAKRSKNLHALKQSVGEKRGKLCLCLKELRDAVSQTVGPGFIRLFAGETNAPKIISVYDLNRATRSDLLTILQFTGHQNAAKADLTIPGTQGWFQWELNMCPASNERFNE